MITLLSYSRAGLRLGFLLCAAALFGAATTRAETGPRIALHLGPPTAKTACAQVPFDCAGFQTHGQTRTEYSIYIVATHIPEEGLAGLDFALSYSTELSVLGAKMCGDYTYAHREWPAAYTGVVATWVHDKNCQDTRSAHPEDGNTALVGVLSAYAYDTAELQLHANSGDNGVEWTGCQATRAYIPPERLGFVGFGEKYGCSPCAAPCYNGPIVEITPTAIDFGPVARRTGYKKRPVRIFNAGARSVRCVLASSSPDFTVEMAEDQSPDFVLDSWQACTFEVCFTPQGNGPHQGFLEVGVRNKRIELMGEGVNLDARGADWTEAFTVLGAAPNPSATQTAIRFTSPAGRVTISVFDVAGRQVWSAQDQFPGVGEHAFVWDGRTAPGSRAPAGIYFFRLAYADQAQNGKIIRVDR